MPQFDVSVIRTEFWHLPIGSSTVAFFAPTPLHKQKFWRYGAVPVFARNRHCAGPRASQLGAASLTIRQAKVEVAVPKLPLRPCVVFGMLKNAVQPEGHRRLFEGRRNREH
jgi:hypothetical protein